MFYIYIDSYFDSCFFIYYLYSSFLLMSLLLLFFFFVTVYVHSVIIVKHDLGLITFTIIGKS